MDVQNFQRENYRLIGNAWYDLFASVHSQNAVDAVMEYVSSVAMRWNLISLGLAWLSGIFDC